MSEEIGIFGFGPVGARDGGAAERARDAQCAIAQRNGA